MPENSARADLGHSSFWCEGRQHGHAAPGDAALDALLARCEAEARPLADGAKTTR
jgi:hypothetical protein